MRRSFSTGAFSNSNESLNATMASKAPKRLCFSQSSSADFRFVCAVGQKNIGEGYTQEIAKVLQLSPGKHHSRHVAAVQKTVEQRRKLIATAAYKKRRMELKKLRASLRHRREENEGITYKTNYSLLTEPAVINEENNFLEKDVDGICIVLLDVETSGFQANCDILQIAALCGTNSFATYINPTRPISIGATEVTGLTNCYGELMCYGKKVQSLPMKMALINLKGWIESQDKKCCIAIHNLSFDGPKLCRAITQHSLTKEFANIIHSFVDTLYLL